MKFKDEYIWVIGVYLTNTSNGPIIAAHDYFIKTESIITFEPSFIFKDYGKSYERCVKITLNNGQVIYSGTGIDDFIESYMDEIPTELDLYDYDENSKLGKLSFS